MAGNDEKINRLHSRLEALIRRHGEIAVEMYGIREELDALHSESESEIPVPSAEVTAAEPGSPRETPVLPVEQEPTATPLAETESLPLAAYDSQAARKPVIGLPPNFERWVGENLISKIGITITILGVAIGAKYAIDKGWITPVMRIVFGYLVGIGLLWSALRLREKYERFSAVLLSGAMAIFYFISFAAYSYYGLIPQALAFALMAGFTAFTVFAALRYERVLIAHIGLIGAYAVPFLLSEGSDRFAFLFSYVAIINVGILAVSVARYWRSLFYPSFILTWAIYGLWYVDKYDPSTHLALTLTFATIFFAVFNATFITYKLLEGNQFAVENVLLILANAFIYYGFTYNIASGNETLSQYLGPITLAHSAIHLAVAASVYKYASADRTVISLLAALVITFVTIAIPVQMDGKWVTLMWIAEATSLFVIARFRSIPLFEYFSYAMVFIASASLAAGWDESLRESIQRPLFNAGFLTGALFACGIALMLWTDSTSEEESLVPAVLSDPMRMILAGILILVVYNIFRLEISNFWRQEMLISDNLAQGFGGRISWESDPYPPLMNLIWQIDYSMVFTAGIWYLNERYLKNTVLRGASSLAGLLWLLLFLTGGIALLGRLRESYLNVGPSVPSHGSGALVIRYVSYLCAALVIWLLYRFVHEKAPEDSLDTFRQEIGFDAILHISLVTVFSAELFTWMDIAGIADSGRLALSILWGVYAVALLMLGIRLGKRHLRIGAIGLFTVTLLKIFLYDLSDLGTVSRTVVFVSLGVLLLIASFLYNKYRKTIFGEHEE